MKHILFFVISFALTFIQSGHGELTQGNCTDGQKASVTTDHTSLINGKQVAYKATSGYLEVTAQDGKSKACVFFTSYVASNQEANRPLTFAFNGGPGSASLWLHMGALGPMRVDMGSDGLTAANPFKLVENNNSLLDISDLVLIDPVATGFSTPLGDSPGSNFFGAQNDYKSIAEFIRNYLSNFNRWQSPKYLMGESYGGVRASLLAHHLQSDLGINLSGVVFISPWLSTTTTNFGESDNDLPYVLFLPTFATTAWYHKKMSQTYQALDVSTVLKKVEDFARTRYWNALQQGSDLSDEEFHQVSKVLADITGISQADVENLNLRISDTDFFSGLLESQNQVVGRYDSRFVAGRLPNQNGASATDPSGSGLMPSYIAAMNFYLQNFLNFHNSSPYLAFATTIGGWPFDSDAQNFGVMGDLSQALIDNKDLRIYVASGIYDLAVPYETVVYNFEHLAPRLNLKSRVSISQYPAGHMMYINPVALKQLKGELTNFYGEKANGILP